MASTRRNFFSYLLALPFFTSFKVKNEEPEVLSAEDTQAIMAEDIVRLAGCLHAYVSPETITLAKKVPSWEERCARNYREDIV